MNFPGTDAITHRTVSRRDFVRGGLGMSLSLTLLGNAACTASAPASASAATVVPPQRARGDAWTSVRDHGARGDGVHDDTAAFRRAIDSLPDDGGTVEVPAGTYVIDPTRRTSLRSRMHLKLAPDAQLTAKPNAQERSFVLMAALVDDVEISGGRILGDRDVHLGSTGEWGHGIALYGARRVTVRDIHVSRCWGDGIGIGGKRVGGRRSKNFPSPCEDVVLSGVTCTGNRRQGLTIGHSRDVRVHDSEFSHTGGTAPQAGIDIEPDAPGNALRVHIENCRMNNNRGCGIQIYKRSNGVTIRDCTIEDNGAFGVLAVGTTNGLIVDNLIRRNGQKGIALRDTATNYQASRNSLSDNRLRRRKRPGSGTRDE